ncbi:hypothetical protein KDK88_05875, partial [bacterium]|nr:hypothetical protein [bacterium]
MPERRRHASPSPPDPAPFLAAGAAPILSDKRLDAVTWLLSAGLRGPCLVVGAGPHPLGLDLFWPDPV